MDGLGLRITDALANPILDDRRIDSMRELAEVLSVVGLDPRSGGGDMAFIGRAPIVQSPLPLATMAAVSLMAKAVSVADLWRFRGGTGQDLSVNLGQVLHRLCPFYDRKWELLNGYPPGNPADPNNPFMPTNMYPTRDGRRILLIEHLSGSQNQGACLLWVQRRPEGDRRGRPQMGRFCARGRDEPRRAAGNGCAQPEGISRGGARAVRRTHAVHRNREDCGQRPGAIPQSSKDTSERRARPGPRPHDCRVRLRAGVRLSRRRCPEHLASQRLRDGFQLLHRQCRHAVVHHGH
jgi:hypothetical protein